MNPEQIRTTSILDIYRRINARCQCANPLCCLSQKPVDALIERGLAHVEGDEISIPALSAVVPADLFTCPEPGCENTLTATRCRCRGATHQQGDEARRAYPARPVGDTMPGGVATARRRSSLGYGGG